MLISNLLRSWGVNSLVKVQLVAQAHELRQRAVKGRIYGFKNRSRSPTKTSKYSGGPLNSLESSPQSDDTYQDESDVEELATNSGAGWIGRALLPNKSPRGSVAPSSRFSTPSRPSLGRLANEESRGRVKGMIESYEHSSGSLSRESSVSDFLSAGDEDKRVDANTAPVPFTNGDLVGESDRELDPDVTITSPVNYAKDLPPLPESPDKSLNVSDTRIDDSAHETSAVNEPSMKDLLRNTEDDDYISSHPWEDEIIGETARRISAIHASVRKSSLAMRRFRTSGSLEKPDESTRTHLLALFTPLPEGGCPLEQEDDSLDTAVTSITHVTAPPSYSDQNVETDLDDIEDRARSLDRVESNEEVLGLLEVFRNRLAEVERKLDEMERREAQRVLAEQEANRRREVEGVAAVLQRTSPPLTDAVEPEKVSIGAQPSKQPAVNRKSPKPKIRPAPKHTSYPEYLHEGIPQFVIGASLGIFVIVVQTLLKRYTGKRP